MAEACPRCGGERGDGRWCATCGLDSTPTAATLPTPEAMEAGNREREWFGSDPEQLRAAEEARAATQTRRERESIAYLESTQPPEFSNYRDLGWRARLARFWLAAVVLLSLASAGLEAAHLSVLGGVAPGDFLDSIEVYDSQRRLLIVYLVWLCAFVLSAGFFIAWTWRAYRNVAALGAQQLRFGFGWAIGGWFVPIMWFWRPKQIVDDSWRASDPQGPAHFRQYYWRGLAVPALLNWWWGLYIVSGLLERFGGRIAGDAATLSGERTGTTFSLLASVTMAVAGVLALEVVRRISARQSERAAAIRQLPPREPSTSPAPAPAPAAA